MAAQYPLAIAALNGDLHLPNDEGEADVIDPGSVVSVPDLAPVPTTDAIINALATEIHAQHGAANARVKTTILAMRLACYRLGLYKTVATQGQVHCARVEIVRQLWNAPARNAIQQAWVDEGRLVALAAHATNLICMVAYIFRQRGHHYKAEYNAFITSKMAKLQNLPVGLVIPEDYEAIFRYGTHAVYPVHLDQFWSDMIHAGRCARSISLRFHVPCAGTAPYFALKAGSGEWARLFPTEAAAMLQDIEYLDRVCADLLQPANRWKGGVNRTLYGAVPLVVDTARLTSLAAAVWGINNADGEVTNLGRSEALKKIAEGAPLTQVAWKSLATGMYRKLEAVDVQDEFGKKAIARALFHG